MASVTSLDKDLRRMRLEKYTPATANEARSWIEDILGEQLPSSDLLEGLKDGVALCKLANLALPRPGVKFKQSAMPFVQMENISQFLRACQAPPLNLLQHDTFLTVDLYEQKDPAQVLQCLGAFSRAANAANPSSFPSPIGPKNRTAMSPQVTGAATPPSARNRGASVTSNNSAYGSARPALPQRTGDSPSGRWSPTKSPRNATGSPGVSSWSKKEHEGSTAPAWNIAQYGYLGGASQGNLGIAFGGRRQITSAGPQVPSLVGKQRLRKEKEAEEERLRQEAEQEEERQRMAEQEADEDRARHEEERLWEEQTRKQRQIAEEEKRQWEEEERQWKLTEEKRRQEERDAETRLEEERRKARSRNDGKLRGQFLSQYQAEQGAPQDGAGDEESYSKRVKELEKELELARQREAEYERERQGRSGQPPPVPESKARARSRSRPAVAAVSSPPSRQDSWSRDEREVLRTQWSQHQAEQRDADAEAVAAATRAKSPRPLPSRPLPNPVPKAASPAPVTRRPLPDPTMYSAKPASPAPAPSAEPAAPAHTFPASRTDRFLASNPAPAAASPQQTYSRELGATAEQDAEDQRRAQSQTKTKAGGWASKSLLEREMEMERQRQREWEDSQKETAKAVRPDDGVEGIGGGVGGRWDVGQWSGFTGGDGQNRGTQGIGAGRRQIVGPRPLPDQPR